MKPPPDSETFGPLLHGAARAWRLKLDERLRPLGMSESSPEDRRCKWVKLQRRAQRVIGTIDDTATQLRHELMADIPPRDLDVCMRVLTTIRTKAEQAPALAVNGKEPSGKKENANK